MRILRLALFPLLAAACGAFDGGGDSGGGDAGDAEGGALDGGATADGGGSSCPGTHGPAGVRIGTYCIDETEVTRAHYEEFMTAKGTDYSGQHAACATNTSFEPRVDWPAAPGEGDLPVIGVDWCDAHAYCAWAGKRLCGRIDGGPVGPSSASDHTQSQWTHACSKGGTLAYPYGSTYDPNACNGGDAYPTARRARPVRSANACQGGYAGLWDMSGNAFEWEDSCNSNDADATCYVRGGDYTQPESIMGCRSTISQPRLGDGRWGFRCCSK